MQKQSVQASLTSQNAAAAACGVPQPLQRIQTVTSEEFMLKRRFPHATAPLRALPHAQRTRAQAAAAALNLQLQGQRTHGGGRARLEREGTGHWHKRVHLVCIRVK